MELLFYDYITLLAFGWLTIYRMTEAYINKLSRFLKPNYI